MWHVWNGEAEMEARRVAHRRIAAGDVDVDAVIRLHEGESRNNNAPNSFDGVERQKPAMPLDKAAHHLRLAARPERRAAPLPRFDGDQSINDFAALHEATMNVEIDAIDLLPECGEVDGFGIVYLVHCAALALLSYRRRSA
jgi:hypothetical protein